jgi:hypothetical protein
MNVSKHEDDKRFKEAGMQNEKKQKQKLSHCNNFFKITSRNHSSRYPYNT